jgi:hypothetical protein
MAITMRWYCNGTCEAAGTFFTAFGMILAP